MKLAIQGRVETEDPQHPNTGKSQTPGGQMADKEKAAKATQDNDLTTGHTEEGDGGDDNSKRKNR